MYIGERLKEDRFVYNPKFIRYNQKIKKGNKSIYIFIVLNIYIVTFFLWFKIINLIWKRIQRNIIFFKLFILLIQIFVMGLYIKLKIIFKVIVNVFEMYKYYKLVFLILIPQKEVLYIYDTF